MHVEKLSDWEWYESREEPDFLRSTASDRSGFPEFVNLQRTDDVRLLRQALEYLESRSNNEGEDYVLLAWFSEPFVKTRGYGVYTREGARALRALQKKERWAARGVSYDIDRELLRVWISNNRSSLEDQL